MALTDKLTDIADAIRAKTGKTTTMKLEEMPSEIASIISEVLLKPSEYPDYVRQETARVAKAVREVLMDDSFVSICFSDSHYPADENTRKSTLHALMAVKGLTYLIPVDFIAHLGDVGLEGSETDTSVLEANIIEVLSYMNEVDGDSIPLFVAIGNHDCGNYITPDIVNDQVSPDWLYEHFTKLSESENTVVAGKDVGGYCYRDFPDDKIRVFLLNTAEELITGGHYNDNALSITQRAWFATQLQELNTKTDAAEWSFIILCHYPADYGATRPLSNLLAAYVEGSSFTDTDSTIYDFNGKNAARFIVQHHGHVHNYIYDKLYKGNLGTTPTQYDAWRIGIPNLQDNRDNYYGVFNQINYKEEVTQTKVPGTVEDTSFVVNVINLSEDKIYSFYYGKGYNRTIGIGKIVYYSINKNVENVTFSNDIVAVEAGQPYNATITIPDNYALNELVITMDGVDITTSSYENNVINILAVTGNIVITAKASKIPTSNLRLIAYSFEDSSTTIYNNGLGYKNGYRLNGNAPSTWETTAAGYVMTGCIPWDRVSDINISGATLVTGDGNCRMYLTNDARNYVYSPWIIEGTSATFADYFTVTEIEEGNKYKLTIKSGWTPNSSITCFALSLKGGGEDLIITFGDDTGESEQFFAITNNLAFVTSNNDANSITPNSSYTATLTANDGYNISSVKVVMGGIDITASAYNSDTNTITIEKVTGHLVITAAGKSTAGYTNQIPLSTTTMNGTEPYNSPYGYKTETRINSSNKEQTASGMCCTGYISLNNDGSSKNQVVRIKNVTISGTQAAYFNAYNANVTISTSVTDSTLINGGSTDNLTVVVDNDMIVITITANGFYAIRLSCGVIDDTSIITVDEEIV